jgi:SAM-dependent methyltransferase
VYRHKPDLKRGGRDVEHAYHEYAANRLEGCWDVEYYANMALKGQYFVWPKYNLVQNTGLTDGTHAEGATAWKLSWEGAGGDIEDLPKDLQANSLLVKGFLSYFRSVSLPVKPRLKRKLKGMVKSATTKALPSVNPDPKHYTTTDGPQEVLSQKECYYYALNNYVNDGDRVLDVGMGIGYGMGVLSIKAREVYAVDVDKKAVEYNKRRLLGRNPRVKDLILYDGKKLPFGDNFFDVVTCIDVIEHVEDYDSFLDELLRVSKRAVVIATPNRRPEYTEPDGTPKNYWHLREWSQREFDEIAQKHSQAKVKWMFVDGPWDGPHKITNKVSSDTLVLLPVFVKKKA